MRLSVGYDIIHIALFCMLPHGSETSISVIPLNRLAAHLWSPRLPLLHSILGRHGEVSNKLSVPHTSPWTLGFNRRLGRGTFPRAFAARLLSSISDSIVSTPHRLSCSSWVYRYTGNIGWEPLLFKTKATNCPIAHLNHLLTCTTLPPPPPPPPLLYQPTPQLAQCNCN